MDRGQVPTALVDVFSYLFYIFVFVLFVLLFSISRGCSGPSEYTVQGEVDTTIEGRLLLLALMRAPVQFSDGSSLSVGEVIARNEYEPRQQELRAAIESMMDGYLVASDPEENPDDLPWAVQITARYGRIALNRGNPLQSCGSRGGQRGQAAIYTGPLQFQSASIKIPLLYDPDRGDQIANVAIQMCTERQQ